MEAPDSTDLLFNSKGGYGEIPTYFDREAEPGVDGNQVDIDTTMSNLAQNAMQYNAAARAISKKISLLKYVSTDGQSS
jgi:flagellar basal-body rod protein FlgB